jgi:lipoteichoic acid synthase
MARFARTERSLLFDVPADPYATSSPGPFDARTEIGQYRNALHEGDAALGQLLEGLAARHLDRNTLIVVFGDHGEAFSQHDGNVAHTQFIYDENVRVPLMMTVGSPGSPGSLRVHRVASLIDVTPTILDLLGLPASPEHQGMSLLLPEPRMALFFTDYALGWVGLRDGCWKYMLQVDAARSALFDVCADPGETIDHAAEQDGRVRAYRERVEQWSTTTRLAVRR